MKKDFKYFHEQAKRTWKEVSNNFDYYDLAVCMEEAYNSGYEDCAEKYKYPGRDPIDTL